MFYSDYIQNLTGMIICISIISLILIVSLSLRLTTLKTITKKVVKIPQASILSLKSFHWLDDYPTTHSVKSFHANLVADHKIFKLTDHFNRKVLFIEKDKSFYYFQLYFEEDINVHDMYIDLIHEKVKVFPKEIALMNQYNKMDLKNNKDTFTLQSTHSITDELTNTTTTFLYAFYKAVNIDGLFALKWIDSFNKTYGIYIGIVIDEVIFSKENENAIC